MKNMGENIMTFNDIFKSNFLEKVNSFSLLDACIVLALAFIVGLFIFVVYKKTYSGVMYSKGFGMSLIAMSMITSFVILAVTSNVVLSLGMVGALSIVRFRTAIKDPMDIVFLFWSLAVGIVLGAGLIPLAIIGSVFIGVIIAIFANIKYTDTPYILAISCSELNAEARIRGIVNKNTKKSLLKASTVTNYKIEYTYEVRIKNDSDNLIKELMNTDGVENVALVSYNGEYMA